MRAAPQPQPRHAERCASLRASDPRHRGRRQQDGRQRVVDGPDRLRGAGACRFRRRRARFRALVLTRVRPSASAGEHASALPRRGARAAARGHADPAGPGEQLRPAADSGRGRGCARPRRRHPHAGRRRGAVARAVQGAQAVGAGGGRHRAGRVRAGCRGGGGDAACRPGVRNRAGRHGRQPPPAGPRQLRNQLRQGFHQGARAYGVQMGASRRNRGIIRVHFSDAARTHVVIRCSCASAASRWIPTSTATRRSGPTCGCEGRIAAAGAWDCQKPVCQLTASQACFDSPRAAPSAPRARRARARA